MSILKDLESSHCQVLEVSTAASILQIVFSALAFSWCPKAPSWSKQGNQYGCDFHVRNLLWTGVPSHFWRLWLLIWLVGVEFPVGLFLFLSNNALHSNWPKQILVLSHWLNSRAPFIVYPGPPFKFKGWKHSICVFFGGLWNSNSRVDYVSEYMTMLQANLWILGFNQPFQRWTGTAGIRPQKEEDQHWSKPSMFWFYRFPHVRCLGGTQVSLQQGSCHSSHRRNKTLGWFL